MKTYRRKPILVEAEQWFPGKDVYPVEEVPGYGHGVRVDPQGFRQDGAPDGYYLIQPGSWVVRFEDGCVGIRTHQEFVAEFEEVGERPDFPAPDLPAPEPEDGPVEFATEEVRE